MTQIILAQYKCSHCGTLNTGSKYISWNNFDGKGPGKAPYIGVCHECYEGKIIEKEGPVF